MTDEREEDCQAQWEGGQAYESNRKTHVSDPLSLTDVRLQ